MGRRHRSQSRDRKPRKKSKSRDRKRSKSKKHSERRRSRRYSDSFSSGSGTSRTFPSDDGNNSPVSDGPQSPNSPVVRDISFSQGLDTGYAFPIDKNALEIPLKKRTITPNALITRKVIWKIRAEDEDTDHTKRLPEYKSHSRETRSKLVRELVHLHALSSAVELPPPKKPYKSTRKNQTKYVSSLTELTEQPPNIELADLDMTAYKQMKWLHECRANIPFGESLSDENHWWRSQTVYLEESDR